MSEHATELITRLKFEDKVNKIELLKYDGCPLPAFPSLRTQEGVNKRIQEIIDLEPRDNDILLCTYPKAGTHWSWEIINMILKGKATLSPMLKIETMIECVVDINNMKGLESPRILDTHLPVRLLPKKFKSNSTKLIHVVRNPKDTVTSYYHHLIKDPVAKDAVKDWDSFFEEFLSGNVPYGSYFKYLKEFEELQKNHKNFLLVYYEDIHKKPAETHRRIADFLGMKIDDKLIKEIEKEARFENMSKNKADFSKGITGDGEGFIFRKGVVGDWKKQLNENQKKKIDEVIDREMKGTQYKFTYE